MKLERYDIEAYADHQGNPCTAITMGNVRGDWVRAEDVDAYIAKVQKLKEAAEGVLREAMFGKLLNVTDMQHVFTALAALEEENEQTN